VSARRPARDARALEPLRQGIRRCFGIIEANVAHGLAVRHDHGSQYLSAAFQNELAFLGIESSPSFVRAPEGNGCAERVIRTLKEQLLWVKTFATVEELRLALIAWAELYNREWLIERHGFRPPAEARRAFYESREKLAA
jgi:transposase InsO family protein